MKTGLISAGLALGAAGFLLAALLGHADAWSPALLLGLAAAAARLSRRRETDKR